MVRGGSTVVGYLGMGARLLFSGRLYVYAFWMLIGVVILWGFATGGF